MLLPHWNIFFWSQEHIDTTKNLLHVLILSVLMLFLVYHLQAPEQ